MKKLRETRTRLRTRQAKGFGTSSGCVHNERMIAQVDYRISGHESFPCRYTWLPKAVRGLAANPKLFSDEDAAMVDLGVGKNMMRAIRFWSQVSGMATGGGHGLTDVGRSLLGERGLDPFLEDIRTLWIIHWNFSTDAKSPLLAWDYLLNRWQEPELTRSRVLPALQREAAKQGVPIGMLLSLFGLSVALQTVSHVPEQLRYLLVADRVLAPRQFLSQQAGALTGPA